MSTKATNVDLLSIAQQHTRLKRVANTKGGEWAGPCPFCGGRDRFRIQPRHPKGPRWFCRHCGDDRWHDAIDFVMRSEDVGFREACRRLGVGLEDRQVETVRRSQSPFPVFTPPTKREPPDEHWQAAASTFVERSQTALWNGDGDKARMWLRQRGLSDEMICTAKLGYNAIDHHQSDKLWGLDTEKKSVWLPRGIVIPYELEGRLWNIAIRRPAGKPKYYNLPGSRLELYNGDSLCGSRPAVLVEGVLDALSIRQAAADLVDPVSSGTGGARSMYWIARLATCPLVLVSFDADEAGDKAAAWWLQVLRNSERWRPYWGDANDLARAGVDLRTWIQEGLHNHAGRW